MVAGSPGVNGAGSFRWCDAVPGGGDAAATNF
jgi:hypothetical protein